MVQGRTLIHTRFNGLLHDRPAAGSGASKPVLMLREDGMGCRNQASAFLAFVVGGLVSVPEQETKVEGRMANVVVAISWPLD